MSKMDDKKSLLAGGHDKMASRTGITKAQAIALMKAAKKSKSKIKIGKVTFK